MGSIVSHILEGKGNASIYDLSRGDLSIFAGDIAKELLFSSLGASGWNWDLIILSWHNVLVIVANILNGKRSLTSLPALA